MQHCFAGVILLIKFKIKLMKKCNRILNLKYCFCKIDSHI